MPLVVERRKADLLVFVGVDMDKEAIYQYLDGVGVWHDVTEHGAVFDMEEMAKVTLPYPGCVAKNLFVRDDKKHHYYLITVKGDKRVDLKMFRKEHETRPLSFASSDDLHSILGLAPGSVTPFGLLNDEECKVTFYLDKEFFASPGIIGVHPNENTATVWLKAEDLVRILSLHGNETHLAAL